MNRLVVGVVIVLAIVSSAGGSEPKAAKAAATGKDEQQVLAADQEWADVEVKHDEAALRRILDDRFVVTDDEGKTMDKAGFIEALRDLSMISQTVDHDVTRVHGDTAVVVGTTTVRFPLNGKEETQPFRYTAVYIKRQGRWRPIAEQFGKLQHSK